METSTILTVLATILPLLHLLGIASAIEVLFRSASAQGAIAWCLFLVIFPVLGLPVIVSHRSCNPPIAKERRQVVPLLPGYFFPR